MLLDDLRKRDARRVLVVRLDNIGDAVMLSPALRALRAALPAARITLLASPAGSLVAPMLPWIDETMVLRAVWQDASNAMPLDPARELQLVEELRCRRFDAAFIFTSFSQSPFPPAYAAYLAGVPVRVGQSREFGGSLLSHSVRPLPDAVHQVDRNLNLLECCGIPVESRQLELQIPEEQRSLADSRLSKFGIDPGSRYILIAPGASCPARRYPVERYAEVARLILQARLPIVVAGNEKEAATFEPILAVDSTRIHSIIGRVTIPELTAIISRASLVIANDSGPMHIADAFHRPMVILFSGTEHESQWKPRYSPAVLLRRATECSPCYAFTCPYCMECLDIPPAEVAGVAMQLLDTEREDLRNEGDQGGREIKEYQSATCVHYAS